jgi:hypothetical protein
MKPHPKEKECTLTMLHLENGNERTCVSRLRHVAALADYGEDKFKPCHEKVALQDGYNIAIPVIM